jgi:hypothetical protein
MGQGVGEVRRQPLLVVSASASWAPIEGWVPAGPGAPLHCLALNLCNSLPLATLHLPPQNGPTRLPLLLLTPITHHSIEPFGFCVPQPFPNDSAPRAHILASWCTRCAWV